MTYRPRSSSVTSQSSVDEGASELQSPAAHSRLRRNMSEKNPVVMAMIKSNTLRNCNDVQDMVSQCMNSGDDKSFMCKTAHSYIANCKSSQ
eukprot:CAMPEP_0113609638 /NCGR_PEP_ID=MMETSP0017_2-20120614/4602_1 /TAXON_ID=2856 /ORGANISM="Cylindrotheca closterium" /LENGTH=90 /DNA_ID=CAMNT_0000518477 /DNA_START=73 /DNA_END=345 /DNA_ORIENTATION=+ /assembly_acc=CAM_ASM_000147